MPNIISKLSDFLGEKLLKEQTFFSFSVIHLMHNLSIIMTFDRLFHVLQTKVVDSAQNHLSKKKLTLWLARVGYLAWNCLPDMWYCTGISLEQIFSVLFLLCKSKNLSKELLFHANYFTKNVGKRTNLHLMNAFQIIIFYFKAKKRL